MTEQRRGHWERVYREKAPGDVSWHQDSPGVSLELIAAAGPGGSARVLDIGGGDSHLVDWLVERGWRDVTVLDISEEALSRAKERMGTSPLVTWVVADITTWEPATQYDVVHDRALFHFLTAGEDRSAYRAVLKRAVRPGGRAIVGTFAVDGPDQCSGLPVARYDAKSLAREAGGAAFVLERSERELHVTPWGATQPFQFAVLRRVDAPVTADRSGQG